MKGWIRLAVAAGVAGATLTGVAPAGAADVVDCTSAQYTRKLASYVPTNVQRPGVDGHSYNISGPQAFTYEVCLDILDSATFAIEARLRSADGTTRVFVDNRPGDKIFRYTPGAEASWQVFGTMSGPPSTYVEYTWAEKLIPA
ncbi:hypothetical protein [Jidongwangia harbinensis]|uniref:hypothetical protein n=1 Tax=Jidongwangia harbinensis TaxID=2878561 RepID=UPI001CD967A2|nr:hypothetical protein [Jidongwangia harbinensis]MCA2219066.1 hypothetical protein [Jidongwangia harbinensis]